MRLDAEREVAQDLRPHPVAQADVLESDHTPLRQYCRAPGKPRGDRPLHPPLDCPRPDLDRTCGP